VGAGADPEGPGHAAERRQLLLERPTFGAQHEVARVDHAGCDGQQLAPERRVLTWQVDERNHLNLGSESADPTPTPVVATCPRPSRLSEKRNSLSELAPGRSGLRRTYSTVTAQQSNLKSAPRRVSTLLVVRRS